MTESNKPVIIREAEARDLSQIAAYVDHVRLIHRNLDWRPLVEWIGKPPFLLRIVDEKITALLSCASDPPGIAWIHCYATDLIEEQLKNTWTAMIQQAVHYLRAVNSSLYTITMHDWYSDLLLHSGFERLQSIIGLAWSGTLPPQLPLSTDILIRSMEPTDLDQVAVVDRLAFAQQWVISPESMRRVFYQAEHTSVAEVEGKVIAYEISTADHFAFHLTRLAVLPGYSRANVGYSLARGAIDYFSRRGIHQGTVNTQDDNRAALSLYDKLGYVLTHENFPVYMYKNEHNK
jgi:ribosomal-protein-alanine N-acetyltransferase